MEGESSPDSQDPSRISATGRFHGPQNFSPPRGGQNSPKQVRGVGKPHIVVLGSNFAGLGVAQKIRELTQDATDITIIDRKPYLLFVPNIAIEVLENRDPLYTGADAHSPESALITVLTALRDVSLSKGW